MKVKELMHGITVVEPGASIHEMARLMKHKNIGSVLVKLNEIDWGIVTERDIITKVVARNISFKETKAKDIMTMLSVTIDSEASVSKASELFNLHHIRRLPVMENGEIIGMLTARDVAKYCAYKSLIKKKSFERESGYSSRW